MLMMKRDKTDRSINRHTHRHTHIHTSTHTHKHKLQQLREFTKTTIIENEQKPNKQTKNINKPNNHRHTTLNTLTTYRKQPMASFDNILSNRRNSSFFFL